MRNVARKQQEPKAAINSSRPYRIEEQIGYLLRRAHQRASSIF
jgi:MarR family transcriptional regulator, lower aerobic nicotinate degradation pathway regulator